MEAVGQLDQDHPDVGGHRHHHLAVVLGLALIAALEGDPGQLGDAVDQLGDLVAELSPDFLQAGGGVLDRVVKQRRAQRLGVEPHSGADLGDAHRVGDELVARVAALIGVPLAGKVKGPLDLGTVDGRHRNSRTAAAGGAVPIAVGGNARSRVELLDHGEKVGEELLVLYGSLGLARNRWASESLSL